MGDFERLLAVCNVKCYRKEQVLPCWVTSGKENTGHGKEFSLWNP